MKYKDGGLEFKILSNHFKNKMIEKKEDLGLVSYILGIVSIVLAFFTPVAGLVFGIVGLVLSKKQKNAFSEKGKKLNTIGITIGIIVLILTVVVAIIASKNPEMFGNFPLN